MSSGQPTVSNYVPEPFNLSVSPDFNKDLLEKKASMANRFEQDNRNYQNRLTGNYWKSDEIY